MKTPVANMTWAAGARQSPAGETESPVSENRAHRKQGESMSCFHKQLLLGRREESDLKVGLSH